MKLARVSVFLCAACVWANVVFAQASQIRDRSTAAIQSTAKKQSHDKANPRITLRVEDFANLDPLRAGRRKKGDDRDICSGRCANGLARLPRLRGGLRRGSGTTSSHTQNPWGPQWIKT